MPRYTPEQREILAQAREVKAIVRKTAKGMRMKSAKPNRGREVDKGYLAWLRRLPCVAGLVEGGCEGPVEAAHLRFGTPDRPNPGLGRKNHDRHCTPLCRKHHQHDQHTGSERAFWTRLGVEPADLTEALYASYKAGEDGLPTLLRFTSKEKAA